MLSGVAKLSSLLPAWQEEGQAGARQRIGQAPDGSAVAYVGDNAECEWCAADQDFVGIDAIDVLAGDEGPLDLVVIAAAADKVHIAHPGERVGDFIGLEEDHARLQVGMDDDVQELLGELVPILGHAGAAHDGGRIAVGTIGYGEAEEGSAAGGHDLLVDVARFLRVHPDFIGAEALVVPEGLQGGINFYDAVGAVRSEERAVQRLGVRA